MLLAMSTGKMLRVLLAGLCVGSVFFCRVRADDISIVKEAPAVAPRKMPVYRVEAADFDASEADIRAVCDSTGRELWRYFPDCQIEPFVVTRGRQGPITLFRRNDRQEIVLRLDTGGAFWSQYSYQFAHEFCHVLAGFREGDAIHKWFEETLCEIASLFVMRAMAKSWKNEPPYPHWANYRDSLREYADDVIRRRDLSLIHKYGLTAFHQKHADELRRNPTQRELNGAMAVVLLHVMEAQPERWEAIRWLNAEAAPGGATQSDAASNEPATEGPDKPSGKSFANYLARWHAAVPDRHQAFVRQFARLYGIEIAAPE